MSTPMRRRTRTRRSRQTRITRRALSIRPRNILKNATCSVDDFRQPISLLAAAPHSPMLAAVLRSGASQCAPGTVFSAHCCSSKSCAIAAPPLACRAPGGDVTRLPARIRPKRFSAATLRERSSESSLTGRRRAPFDAIGASPRGSAIYRGRKDRRLTKNPVSEPISHVRADRLDCLVPGATFSAQPAFPESSDHAGCTLAGLDSKKRVRCRHETFIESNLGLSRRAGFDVSPRRPLAADGMELAWKQRYPVSFFYRVEARKNSRHNDPI
ncbi:hypothetical protein ACVK00_000510 [Burkholderia sp. PvR073]